MKYTYQGREYDLQRYPKTFNRSLQPLSAADELLLDFFKNNPAEHPVIQHDRFGVLACCLLSSRPVFVSSFASQEKALAANLAANGLIKGGMQVISPLDTLPHSTELVLVRMPKSLDLFEFYLAQAVGASSPNARIVVGFMTRYFTPRMLEIAHKYAGQVTQSKAKKKARLFILNDLKSGLQSSHLPEMSRIASVSTATTSALHQLMHSIPFGGTQFQQFYGVFSASHIDYATQFLLPFLPPAQTGLLPDASLQLLDIGCGNGIIGHQLLQLYPNASLTVTEDAALAIASARLNLDPDRTTFIYDDSLTELAKATQDLVVTNPPFHLDHENNIEVSLSLFRQASRVLKPNGQFILVANRHLNYITHLVKVFSEVKRIGENDKFEVLSARH